MAKEGASAYADVDGETVHDIPCTAIRGRAGTHGKTFAGWINLEEGTMRFDCAEELPFYLEVDLRKAPFMSMSPPSESGARDGGSGYHHAEAEFASFSRPNPNGAETLEPTPEQTQPMTDVLPPSTPEAIRVPLDAPGAPVKKRPVDDEDNEQIDVVDESVKKAKTATEVAEEMDKAAKAVGNFWDHIEYLNHIRQSDQTGKLTSWTMSRIQKLCKIASETSPEDLAKFLERTDQTE